MVNVGCFGTTFLSSLCFKKRGRNRNEEEERRWEHLPPDLLQSIAEHLSIPDCLRLRQVCPSWASALRSHLSAVAPPRFPWLMLMNPTRRDEYDLSFLKPSVQGYYLSLNLSLNSITSCVGHKEGWLVIVHNSTEILLLNPLSGDRIPLPPSVSCTKRVRKVVLSARPSPGSKFSAVLISEEGTLAFAGEGDEAWTPIRADTSTTIFHDVVHHDGHFVTVSADACSNRRGNLQVFDIITTTTAPSASVTWIAAYGYNRDTLEYEYNRHRDRAYLVSSPSGLLQVLGYKDSEDFIQFKYFVILKFSPESRDSSWETITSLDDRALFLDANGAHCLSAEAVPGVKRNCIYFANKYSGGDGEFDVGLFDMKKITNLSCFPSEMSLPGNPLYPPIWFMASLG